MKISTCMIATALAGLGLAASLLSAGAGQASRDRERAGGADFALEVLAALAERTAAQILAARVEAIERHVDGLA